MNDVNSVSIFLNNCNLLATVFLKAALAVAVIRAAQAVFGNDEKKPQPVPTPEPKKQSLLENEIVDEAPVAAPARVAAPTLPVPKVTESVDLIECGNCHQVIRSSPITNMMSDNQKWNIYKCEHCGVTCQLAG